jgi:hypothetical protein
VVYGDAHLIDAEDRVVGRYYTQSWDPRQLVERPFLCQPAVFFRRRMIQKFGLLDADLNYTLDYEYWLRLARGGARFAYAPVTLASSRVHDDTKTLTGGLRIHHELSVVLKRYAGYVPDGWLLTQTQAVVRERGVEHFKSPVAFALQVAVVSWRLSLQHNGSISPWLVRSTLRTLGSGLVKTALRRPVALPLS